MAAALRRHQAAGSPLPGLRSSRSRTSTSPTTSARCCAASASSLQPGDFVGIVGPNGSGKSTLVDLIDGIHQPAAGEVLVKGVPTRQYRRRDMAREVALVPQHFDLDFDLAVREVVEMGAYCRGKDPAVRGDPELTLARLGVADLASRRFSELSGGEKQLVVLAQALMQQAPLLLLDEPASALDVSHQLRLFDLLKELNADGLTVLCILHDLNLALHYFDKLLVLSDGEVAAFGPPDDVLRPEVVEAVYGVRAYLHRHAGRTYLTFSPRLRGERRGRVHLICGGGTGAGMMRELVDAGYEVTAGVLNALDTDEETGRELGLQMAVEAPFSPVGDEAHAENLELLRAADLVVVSAVPGQPRQRAQHRGGARGARRRHPGVGRRGRARQRLRRRRRRPGRGRRPVLRRRGGAADGRARPQPPGRVRAGPPARCGPARPRGRALRRRRRRLSRRRSAAGGGDVGETGRAAAPRPPRLPAPPGAPSSTRPGSRTAASPAAPSGTGERDRKRARRPSREGDRKRPRGKPREARRQSRSRKAGAGVLPTARPGPPPSSGLAACLAEQLPELGGVRAVLLRALAEQARLQLERVRALHGELLVVARGVLLGLDELLDGRRPARLRLGVEHAEVRGALERAGRGRAVLSPSCALLRHQLLHAVVVRADDLLELVLPLLARRQLRRPRPRSRRTPAPPRARSGRRTP